MTLLMTWNAPPLEQQNGIIREYFINVTVTESGEQFQLSSNSTSLRLYGLHPFYTYSYIITAVTVGPGPFSEAGRVQMPPDGNLFYDRDT